METEESDTSPTATQAILHVKTADATWEHPPCFGGLITEHGLDAKNLGYTQLLRNRDHASLASGNNIGSPCESVLSGFEI